MSYLQAAVVFHELHNLGSQGHEISWARDVFLTLDTAEDPLSLYEWTLVKETPANWEPYFYYNSSGHPVIVFHTINDIGKITLNQYVHVFNAHDYTLQVEKLCIASC